ncbi:MAG TPA: hypothetical protein VGC15_14625 [Acetobacteraceae bacterium]
MRVGHDSVLVCGSKAACAFCARAGCAGIKDHARRHDNTRNGIRLCRPAFLPAMRRRDLDRLHRLISTCLVVMRTNLAWAELGRLVPAAGAAQKRIPTQSAALQMAGPGGASSTA